jgi:hypothetical protein
VVIDAVNNISGSTRDDAVALAAVKTLDPAVKSGNNGVRIPAINAVVQAVRNTSGDGAFQAALDAMVAPLESAAAIGGMEVRMMAVAAIENSMK